MGSRRRKALVTATALLAASYASYRLYNSATMTHKRKRLEQILSTLSLLCEAAFSSAQTFSLLLSDFHGFVRSDDDDVPRSLKQLFKLGQCQEIQQTLVLSSCAVTRGIFSGIKSEIEDHIAKGFKEAYSSTGFTRQRKMRLSMIGRLHRHSDTVAENEHGFMDIPHGDSSVMIRKKKWYPEDRACKDKLSEGLFDKMLTEKGTGFASTVVGSVARNLVLGFFDGLQRPTSCQNEDIADKSIAVTRKTILEFLLNERLRPLIAECIQIFVSTSVSVYIDKTKGLNVFDDVVAGITNPSYQAPLKEFLSLICKESVETFIKTASMELFHNIAEESGGSEVDKTDHSQELIQFKDKLRDSESTGTELRSSKNDEFKFLKLFVDEEKNPSPAKGLDANGGNLSSRNQSTAWISGARVDAFTMNAENRKLLVELVGTMTSEATKSFCEVVVGTFSSFFGLNARRILSRVTPWRIQSLR